MPTVAPLDLDGHCVAVAWLSDIPHFALADGVVHRLDNGHKHLEAHDRLLCTVPSLDGKALVTGGEDGKIMSVAPNGTALLLPELGRKWITSVASRPQRPFAYASGRSAYVRDADGKVRQCDQARSVEGLAFAPNGMRLGVARYNGATVHCPAPEGKPTGLEWAGAHTGITCAPNGD